MILAILAIFLGNTSFAIADILLKRCTQLEEYLPIVITRSFMSVIILGFLLLFFDYHPHRFLNIPNELDWSLLPGAIVVCFISANGLFFFMKGIEKTKMVNVVALKNVNLLIAILISVFVLNQVVTLSKIIALTIAMVGIMLIEHFHFTKHHKPSASFWYILLATIFWSAGYLFVPFVKNFGVLLFSMILECVVLLSSILYYIASKREFNISKWEIKSTWKPLLLVAIIGIIGDLGKNFAIVTLPIVLYALLGLVTPIITLVLSRFLLKEEIKPIQLLGISLGIIGTLIYSF